ncbi:MULTISPECIES: Crp/Fnr family transcriptional regulator [unclassified Mesorhizobium]|uniref:Crp/Fnr family transcriptional regulator n=1 Tax=unclassified Mesorhizobium TaxID=325217 RepID=UPI000BAFE180|nr:MULTISPECIES: Crp/Fnr family transcriptional regulator [unclassified Mesorhizobium]PBB23931.1 Crp/Fnr family transcriptional regulator [Mesorhizobium sp. WSM4304]PBB72908.1 Crp/Fnr family transcriptional regulator [Mesorhizobium sp. WSM4308]
MSDLTTPLIRKLESLGRLIPGERESVEALALSGKELTPGQQVAVEGDEPSHCCLVVEGLLRRYSILSNGNLQTLSIHVAGDIPDLQALHLRTMDHTLASIGRSKIALIAHRDILEVLRKSPRLANLFWRESLVDAAVARAWVKALGGQDALRRFAHLACELYSRMEVMGLVDDNGYSLPLTQAQIGETIGASVVHVNRILKKLRADRLVEHKHGRLIVIDWDGLSELAEFDPGYLNLRDPRYLDLTPAGG